MDPTVEHPGPKQGPDQYDITQLADLIDQAAQLIDTNGLAVGDWWTSAALLPWGVDVCLCTVGAIGVAAGYRRGWEIDTKIAGTTRWDTRRREYVHHDMHPALAELMRRLGLPHLDELFQWSDGSTQAEVVTRLRAVAAQMRIDWQTGMAQLALATSTVGDLTVDELDQSMPALRDLATSVTDPNSYAGIDTPQPGDTGHDIDLWDTEVASS